MAVKIRMKRTGATNDVCYRLVAADMRSPRDGKNLEILGWYNPGSKGQPFELKLDRIDYWLGVGAQISDTASSLVCKARKAGAEPVAAESAEAPVTPASEEREEAPEAPAEAAVEADAN